LTPNS